MMLVLIVLAAIVHMQLA